MLRLIDADELISRLEHWKNLEDGCRAGLVQNAINHVIITTTIDLVRCRECKYYKLDFYNMETVCACRMWVRIPTTPNDYCSHGERSTDEADR